MLLLIAVLVLLILMEVFLVIAILSNVSSLQTITQIIFGGLTILGLYMIWRAVQALSVLREPNGNQLAVIDHIGFILISLFDAFAIVSSIDLHAPVWLALSLLSVPWRLGFMRSMYEKRCFPCRVGE